MSKEIDFGIIQITTTPSRKNISRMIDLKNEVIPACVEASKGNYTLVSPENRRLKETVESLGGTFLEYSAWEKDKSRKFRDGLKTRSEEWIGFWDDDIIPDSEWRANIDEFLQDAPPAQYGFRLTDRMGHRHEFGEDWMQFPNQSLGLRHRGLRYDVETGYIERSPTCYVSNSIVHRDVYRMVEPFGIFQQAPDVGWSFAIKDAGFGVDFILSARALHIGNRKDNR